MRRCTSSPFQRCRRRSFEIVAAERSEDTLREAEIRLVAHAYGSGRRSADEIRATRSDLGARIERTNERVDQINARLERIERRQTEGEIRLVTLLTEVSGDLREVRDELRASRATNTIVADHEQRIRKLEGR